jgi:hypothetical protein
MAHTNQPPNPPPSSAPRQAAEANRSNQRIDQLDAQLAWMAHIDAGRIQVR